MSRKTVTEIHEKKIGSRKFLEIGCMGASCSSTYKGICENVHIDLDAIRLLRFTKKKNKSHEPKTKVCYSYVFFDVLNPNAQSK